LTKGKGADFEVKTCEFLKDLFEELGFLVIEARQQKSGTQNGFDVLIKFVDDYGKERNFHFECKDYESALNWEKILIKIHELSAMSYSVDGFFSVLPKIDISNIHHHMENDLPEKVSFPIKHWTPETCVKDYFALDPEIYKQIYNEDTPAIDRDFTLRKLKAVIKTVLDHKDTLSFTGSIHIKEAECEPTEDVELKTTLDRKLNSVLAEGDAIRAEYHQQRCDYKIYLEELQDVNNQLRSQIVNWQENMRLKADRLTRKFQTQSNYTAVNFFNDFFETAEKDLMRFLQDNKLKGDDQKLLNGVIFELAAECKLNWSAPKVEA
jgi:hypothetical protein